MLERRSRAGFNGGEGGAGKEHRLSGSFSAVKEYDPVLGFEVARLEVRKKDPRENISAVVLPVGASLSRLTYGEEPILRFDPYAFLKRSSDPGWSRQFFPSMLPGRHRGDPDITGSRKNWVWNGKTHSFESLPERVKGLPYLVHGLQHNQFGEYQQPAAGDTSASVTTILPWDRSQKDFGFFPYSYLAEFTTAVTGTGVMTDAMITNTGDRPMPALLGDHPYFEKHPDSRFVLPSSGWWETDDSQIPTGRIIPIPPELDFNDPGGRKVDIGLDHSFLRKPGENPYLLHPKQGIRVDIAGFDQNNTVHAFTFPGSDFLCVELVPIANIYNLNHEARKAGNSELERLTNPGVIQPSERVVYSTQYILSRIPQAS